VRSARDVRLVGGGGTDMRRGIQAAIEDLKAKVIVVLTDGYTPWPDVRPRGVHVVAGMVGHERGSLPAHPDWLRAVAIPRRQLHGGAAH
jgi:predicted metal-dependent peptidase